MISRKTTLAELGAIVCEALQKSGIEAFLSGGAVVSIYTENRYESYDLDFVSLADRKKIKQVMEDLGFSQDRGRLFRHAKTLFFVEFPGSAIQIGESLIQRIAQYKTKRGTLKLLTPTDCVKDRLAAYYHWNDRQALDLAVWVCLAQPVKLSVVQSWSKGEGMNKKYALFLEELKKQKTK